MARYDSKSIQVCERTTERPGCSPVALKFCASVASAMIISRAVWGQAITGTVLDFDLWSRCAEPIAWLACGLDVPVVVRRDSLSGPYIGAISVT